MDQQVGVGGGGDRGGGRRGVAGDDDRAAAAARSHHLVRRDRTGVALDRLSALERRVGGPFRDAGSGGRGGIEPSRPLGLDKGVAVGAGAVLGFERAHLVFVVLDRFSGRQLDQLERVPEATEEGREDLKELRQPRRPVDLQRYPPVGEVVGLQQSRQPQHVVGVEVRQEDRIRLHQPERALHLPLRPFAAVEQQPLPPTRHQHARRRAPRRGHRPPGAEKSNRQIHRRRAYVSYGLICRVSARSSAG